MCETYATPKINTIATCLRKQVKHLKHTLATCVYNHCNICNIPNYFCNINVKHLQHTNETSEHLKHTVATCTFLRNVTLLLGQMENLVAELDASAEVRGGAWSSPVP